MSELEPLTVLHRLMIMFKDVIKVKCKDSLELILNLIIYNYLVDHTNYQLAPSDPTSPHIFNLSKSKRNSNNLLDMNGNIQIGQINQIKQTKTHTLLDAYTNNHQSLTLQHIKPNQNNNNPKSDNILQHIHNQQTS